MSSFTFPVVFTKKQVLFDNSSNSSDKIIKGLSDKNYFVLHIQIPLDSVLNTEKYIAVDCQKPKWITDEILHLNLERTIKLWQVSHIVRQGSSNCSSNQFKIYIKETYCNELSDTATAIFLDNSHCVKQIGGTAEYFDNAYSKKLKKGIAKFHNNSRNINQCGGKSEHYEKSQAFTASGGVLEFYNESVNNEFKGDEDSTATMKDNSINKKQKNGTVNLYGSSVNLEMAGGDAFVYEQAINKNQKNGTAFVFNNISSINKTGGTCYKMKS